MTISLDDFFIEKCEWDGPYELISCKKALSPSNLPEMDYALNPYTGCAHGCIYCYAPEVTHNPWKGWRVPKVKTNIPDRLYSEIKGITGIIGIGTVTDPYQEAEKKFSLTSRCLDVISATDVGIHMHTKSDLILRDVDKISKIKHKIAITVTNVDDTFSKITEPGAPLPSVRFDTIASLVSQDINVYALIGPVLSTLKGKEQKFIDFVIKTNVKTAYIDRLNSRPQLNERLSRMGISSGNESVEIIRKGLTDAGIRVFDVFEKKR